MAFDEVTFFEFHLHGDPRANFAPSISSGGSEGDAEEEVEADGGEAAVAADLGEAGEDDADTGGSGGGLGRLLLVAGVLVVVALAARKLRGGDDAESFEGVDRIED